MIIIGVTLGALLATGILLIAVGTNPDQAPTPARPGSRLRRLPARLTLSTREKYLALAGLIAGVLLAAFGGWIIALVLAPLVTVGMPRLLTYPRSVDPDTLEALEEWVRALAGVLAAEAALSTAIIATLPSAPAPIRPAVQNLVTRLQARRPLPDALYAFADELDSQTGDYVAAALIQASTVSGAGLTRTLNMIAAEVADEVRVRRAIGVERDKAVNQARWVSGISVAGVVLFVLLTDFGTTYRTPSGQLVLLGFAGAFTGALLWLRARATAKAPARFLVRPADESALV